MVDPVGDFDRRNEVPWDKLALCLMRTMRVMTENLHRAAFANRDFSGEQLSAAALRILSIRMARAQRARPATRLRPAWTLAIASMVSSSRPRVPMSEVITTMPTAII